MFEAWLRQQDAIESDLHRIIAEDALRMISNRFEERFRASFPALPRGFSLQSIELAPEGFGDMPYDLQGQHFPRDENHTLGAVGPVRRLCSIRKLRRSAPDRSARYVFPKSQYGKFLELLSRLRGDDGEFLYSGWSSTGRLDVIFTVGFRNSNRRSIILAHWHDPADHLVIAGCG